MRQSSRQDINELLAAYYSLLSTHYLLLTAYYLENVERVRCALEKYVEMDVEDAFEPLSVSSVIG